MQINWATAKDTPDLAQVFYAAVREGPSPYTQAQRAAWMPQQPAPDRFAQRLAIQQVAVAKVSGMPVGFMTVTDAGYIDLAYILHAHRGAGVFRALYAQIEDAARQMSMARLSTHASLMAQPAFQAVGFCVIHHETVERAGVHLPRAKMEKTSDMTPEEIAKLPYRPCVGVMLINAQDEVFVGQRLDSKTQAWQMPQGGVEKREEPRAAALRELWEETGVDPALVTVLAESAQWLPYELPFDLVPKLWKGRYRGQEQKWFLMRFNGSDADINIATEHPEFSHWRWLAPAELVANIVPFKRDVYVAVLDEFRAHL